MSGTVKPTWSRRRSPGIAIGDSSSWIRNTANHGCSARVQHVTIWILDPIVWHPDPDRRRAACPSTARCSRRRPGSRSSSTDADWDAADPEPVANDLRPAGLDPCLRAVRARPRRRRPDPRAGALEHRPGGRRRRLGARAHQRGLGQRLPPRPSPVPGQGAAPRRAEGPRSARRSERRGARGPAAHPGRDLRPRPRVEPRPRRLDAPAVEAKQAPWAPTPSSAAGSHRRPASRGPTDTRAPTPSRSPTSVTVRPTSARPWRR